MIFLIYKANSRT